MVGRAARLIAAGSAALLLGAGPVLAQQGPGLGPPVRLGPPPAPPQPAQTAPRPPIGRSISEGPVPATPAIGPGDASAAPRRSAASEEPVSIAPLQALDPSSGGALRPADGAFGADLWAGSRRSTIEALLPRLPVAMSSPAMRDLFRRLLLSPAAVPEGAASGPSFLARRVERLYAAGEVQGARDLIAVAGVQFQDPPLEKLKVDLLLLDGDTQGACTIVEPAVRSNARDAFWLKAATYCRAVNGQSVAARMTADALVELGSRDDAFSLLVAALSGDTTVKIDSLPLPTPLHLAMLRAAKLPVPTDAVAGAAPPLLYALAGDRNATPEVRLAAAERAVILGLLPGDRLATAYQDLDIPAAELVNAVSLAQSQPGPRANARLYQAARAQPTDATRAEALKTVYEIARKETMFPAAARANLGTLRLVQPAGGLAWFAGDAGRALLVNGDIDGVRVWYTAARGLANDPNAAKAVADLWPLIQIADRDAPWTPEAVSQWWRGMDRLPDVQRRTRAGFVFTMFEALGYAVPPGDWQALANAPPTETGTQPSPATWYGLRAATNEARLGETVTYALLTLGEGGPGAASALTLDTVVRALRAVGLEREARALALEAVLARAL